MEKRGKMTVGVMGISRRESNGRVYSNIYGYTEFSDYEKEHGAQGHKGITINTGASTTHVQVGDMISVSYEPTGFMDKNGSPQFRVSAVDVLKDKKS